MDYGKISIIMGIYNCAPYLDEAIESVLAQTYTNWEMIMCDDCSSDNTYEIAKVYVEKYPEKFILLKNETNLGLNKTLNKCLERATGKYIARMDGDDISHPERFEKEIKFLEENKEYAIVSTPMQYFDEDGVFAAGKGGNEPRKEDIIKGTPFCHAPCMVLKEAYDKVSGYSESKKLLRAEDYHLWIKMYELGFKGYNLSEALYKMRDDRNALNRRKYRYRINEAYVKCIAVNRLKLPKWNYIYALKPLMVGLLPKSIYKILHRRRIKS